MITSKRLVLVLTKKISLNIKGPTAYLYYGFQSIEDQIENDVLVDSPQIIIDVAPSPLINSIPELVKTLSQEDDVCNDTCNNLGTTTIKKRRKETRRRVRLVLCILIYYSVFY